MKSESRSQFNFSEAVFTKSHSEACLSVFFFERQKTKPKALPEPFPDKATAHFISNFMKPTTGLLVSPIFSKLTFSMLNPCRRGLS